MATVQAEGTKASEVRRWGRKQPPHDGRERVCLWVRSTDSAGCLVSRDRWSCDIGLLSQLPNLEPCEPRGRNGDELATMVSLLRVRWGGGVDVSKARNVWRLAF